MDGVGPSQQRLPGGAVPRATNGTEEPEERDSGDVFRSLAKNVLGQDHLRQMVFSYVGA